MPLSIIDLHGRTVVAMMIGTPTTHVATGSLPRGVYQVVVGEYRVPVVMTD
jgi:hypothetical protein